MNAKIFLQHLYNIGFSPITGVPCSIFAPLISSINNANIQHYICSSEDEAMGLAAGFSLVNRTPVVYMQNDGFANAMNPVTSLQLLYKLPALLLISWRGEPGTNDAFQHEVMGRSLLAMLKIIGLRYSILEDDEEETLKVLRIAKQECVETSTPYCLIIRRGLFSVEDGTERKDSTHLWRRSEYVNVLSNNIRADDIILGATGHSGREMCQIMPQTAKFYMMGSMGCLSSIGLALALELANKRVIILDGDGAILMKMGSLAAVGHYKPNNFIHLCFDNNSYESTGNQPTLSNTVNLPAVALACGYNEAISINCPHDLKRLLLESGNHKKPIFVHIRIASGAIEGLERPKTHPEKHKAQFMESIT